ncbi:MAG: LytTR family transcriptional regulator [Bacteroidales bacterium]|nr:LytTR family transcriptional regulator [Bacteroidales bacterium]
MLWARDKVPEYLLGKVQLISTVTFAALFSVFFFIAVVPSSNLLFPQLETSQILDLSLLVYGLGLLLVSLSRRLMYACREWVGQRFGRYLWWCLLEILLVAGAYLVLVGIGERKGLYDQNLSLAILTVRTVMYCLMTLGIPYLLAGMFFAIRDKDQTIRMIHYGNVVSDEEFPVREEQKITLFDNNGAMKLSINADSLYFIESDDNYIKVWYTDSKDVLKQYMLRCRLKTIEDSFRDSDLVRCHRKYIVNMSKVRVLSKERNGYVLELNADLIDPIPVSKTYEETVLSRFNARGGLSAPLG